MSSKNNGPKLPKAPKQATPERALPRLHSVQTILTKKYKLLDIPQFWIKYLGHPAVNFNMCVTGKSGSGKTTLIMRICKMLASLGLKVYYNSAEEGDSKTIQNSFERAEMGELGKGMFMLGDKHSFDEMVQICEMKRGPQVIVVDSIQAQKFTKDQYTWITKAFPKKCFIFISWEKGSEPEGDHAKGIEYMCDIKIRVKDGVAVARSRYGHTVPYEVYPARQTTVDAPEPPAKKVKAKKSGGPLFPDESE